eukprot:c26047_g1_i5 orf=213-1028(+)
MSSSFAKAVCHFVLPKFDCTKLRPIGPSFTFRRLSRLSSIVPSTVRALYPFSCALESRFSGSDLPFLRSYHGHVCTSVSILHFSFLPVCSWSSAVQSENATNCWACGEQKIGKGCVICPSCNAAQYLDSSINYFQIFDLDAQYELDLKNLEVRYKNLMKKLHPDLHHGKTKEEQANSATLSAVVTTAYQDLSNPVSRATYLLQLQGINVEDEGTVTDPDLLMEVMEMRESLEETSNDTALKQLYSRVFVLTSYSHSQGVFAVDQVFTSAIC